jgi:hypothetical protein
MARMIDYYRPEYFEMPLAVSERAKFYEKFGMTPSAAEAMAYFMAYESAREHSICTVTYGNAVLSDPTKGE